MTNKTKIIATITDKFTQKQLIDLHKAGVNILRFNFSHAKQETTKPILDLVHKLNKSGKTDFGLLLDTKGPEVRTGEREVPYSYKKGEVFRIFTDKSKMSQLNDLFADYPDLIKEIKVGKHIAIESGLFDVEIVKKTANYLVAKALTSCSIGSRRHMNFPGISLKLPAFTAKDKSDLKFAMENGMNFIAVSFVRDAKTVLEIRKFLGKITTLRSQGQPMIIAKIENQEGIDNFEEIVKVADGVIVARGDLGIEIPITELPYEQSRLIEICRKYGKPCIMATELLKSMTDSPFPTRAEVSDVYNSVIAGVDLTMLSDETAIGKYPVESVNVMRKTITEAESHTKNPHTDIDICKYDEISVGKKYLVKHALMLADELDIKNVIIFTHSGNLAKLTAGYKPNQAVFAFSADKNTVENMKILYGIQGIKLDKWEKHTTENQDLAIKYLLKIKKIKKSEKVLIIADKNRGQKKDPLIRITIA